ncbi:unnamed protein product, partial [Symbiodinium pilosum]
ASYWFKCCRVVCSFALLENQQDVKFTRTIVDVDGSYVSKHKAAASNRDPCTLPENKGAAGPAERRSEIEDAMERHIAKDCYVGADSGPAIQSMCAKMEVPASAAVHSAEIFRPLVKFPKYGLTPGQIRTMRKFAKPKRAVAKVKGMQKDSRTFQTVGGDNTAEAQFSSAKHQLRRQNLLGRAGAKRATSALLAGPYQNHVPGLAPLLQAFSVYFMDRLGVDPYKVFEEADPWHVLDV